MSYDSSFVCSSKLNGTGEEVFRGPKESMTLLLRFSSASTFPCKVFPLLSHACVTVPLPALSEGGAPDLFLGQLFSENQPLSNSSRFVDICSPTVVLKNRYI